MLQRKCAVVVVLYEAEIPLVYLSLSSFDNNIVYILVDNTPNRNLNMDAYCHLIYIPLKNNFGIAYAQNIGICEAIKRGCDYIVFFDQDSDVSNEYIHDIVDEFVRVQQLEPMIATLGPLIYNADKGSPYKRYKTFVQNCFQIVPTIISSGSIVPTMLFDKIGLYEADLFIDLVDHEWCWRATNSGYKCCQTQLLKLYHSVGKREIRFLGVPFWEVTPIRNYYQYRNFIILLRRKYVPARWKMKNFIRRFAYIFVIPFISKKRRESYKYIFRGIYDGVRSFKI